MKKKSAAQFADTYEGCQVVANLMGLNVETVRKRAKGGKLPAKQNARGVWVFSHSELVAKGIHPFAAAGPVKAGVPISKALAQPTKNRTDVVFVLDRSGSMTGFEGKVCDSLNAQIGELRRASGPNDCYAVSVINFDSEISRTMLGTDVTALSATDAARGLYEKPRGNTALYDAIADAIAVALGRDNGTQAFLISVLTDGGENSSTRTNGKSLGNAIRDLIGTGRYTFTYAGPRGSESIAIGLGIPEGNCTTWHQTTAGFMHLAANTTAALGSYTQSRSRGVMRSETFYAQPVTSDASKFAKKLDVSLADVTADVRVERVTPTDPLKISEFGNSKFGGYRPGQLYYELTESEKVQDYKGIVVQDKTKGRFFSGWSSAKQLLGIPDFTGTVRIRPGDLGDFKVFVQSTSLNRKLEPGTAVVKLGA